MIRKVFELSVAILWLNGVAHAEAGLEASVIHSWTSGSEAAAVRVLADAFERKGGRWIDKAVAGFENADAIAVSRIIAGDPPSAKMFVAGPSIDDLIDHGLLEPIDAVFAESGAAAHLPEPVLQAVTRGGHVYAAPLDVHAHWLFYSSPVLRAAGIARQPESWDEFFAALDHLKAAGFVPIAWGGQTWQELTVFDMVVLAQLGTADYVRAYRDHDISVVHSPRFRSAVEIFARLRAYVDAGAPGRNWNDAAAMLISGQAGILFAGDWATGEFLHAGKAEGRDFSCAGPPGLDASIILSDTFVFPKSPVAAQKPAQALLAATVLDPEVQLRMSRVKGSIPSRTDVDVARLEGCARKAADLIAAGRVVPYRAMVLSPDRVGILGDLIAEFWSDPAMSPDRFIKEFAEAIDAAG